MDLTPADAFAISKTDGEWLSNLKRLGTPGRQLLEHLQCVDIVLNNKSRTECPVQQVALFRRIFCRAYAQNPTCFGLPQPAPQCIAVVNLSGYRAILYSKRVALIRLLCMVGPDASTRVMQNVQLLLHYALQHKCSVLCSFSLPWQAGVQAVHWELRTLERRADGTVCDGGRSYSYTHEEIRAVASSSESDFGEPAQMQAQMEAMEREFAACDVDTRVESDDGVDAQEKLQKMQGILAGMQADRAKLHAQRAQLQEKHAEELAEAKREAEERIAKTVDKTMVSMAVAKKREEELEKQRAALQEQNSTLEKKNAQIGCEKATQDLNFCAERQALSSKASMQEIAAKNATEKLSALEKSSTRERSLMEKSHTKQTEDLERRLQAKTIEARKFERERDDLHSANVQLDKLVEKMHDEKIAMNFELDRNRQQRIAFQVLVAMGTKTLGALRKRLERSEAAQAELVQMLATAEGAAGAAEEEQTRSQSKVAELEKQLEEWEQKTAEMADCESKAERIMVTQAVNTEPQQDPVELTDLRVEIGQLNTEKEAWAIREQELRQQLAELNEARPEVESCPSAASSPTACDQGKHAHSSVRQEVHNNVYNNVVMGNGGAAANGWPAPIELGADQHGDASMEALVGQVQHAMRAIVDIARSGIKNKHLVESVWSENLALKRLSGDGAWPQQVAYWPGEMVPVMPHPTQMMQPHPMQPPPQQWAGHGGPNGPRSGRRQVAR